MKLIKLIISNCKILMIIYFSFCETISNGSNKYVVLFFFGSLRTSSRTRIFGWGLFSNTIDSVGHLRRSHNPDLRFLYCCLPGTYGASHHATTNVK